MTAGRRQAEIARRGATARCEVDKRQRARLLVDREDRNRIVAAVRAVDEAAVRRYLDVGAMIVVARFRRNGWLGVSARRRFL